MQVSKGLPSGDVSCRVTEYTIQYLERKKLPTQHLTRGLSYTLGDLQLISASIPWDDYLIFFRNSHEGLTPEQIVEFCSSDNRFRYLRPLLSAAGLWIKPSRYYELAGDSKKGVLLQFFRCLQTEFTQVNGRDVEIAIVVRDGFSLPPDLFWQTQAIGLGAVTTNFGLSPSIVTWEPIERGVVFRIRVPARRPVRFAFLWLASWFRREAVEDVRTALAYGHERGMRLEREIEQRKRAEVQLREQSAKLEALTASSVAYILEVDRGGVIRYANRTSEGRKLEDLIGKQVTDFVTEPERTRALRIFEHVFVTKKSFTGEFFVPNGQDAPRYYTVTIAPLHYGGKGDGLVLTAFDITEQRAAEAKIRAKDELLHKLTEQVPGILYQFQRWPDGRNCFPYASKGIQEIFGVTPENVLTSGEKVFLRVHADDLYAVMASIRRSEETMEFWRCECRVHVPNRGLRWVEGHAAPQSMPDGSILWHGFIRDFTDRRRIEQALRENEERLQQAIRVSRIGIFDRDHIKDSTYWSPEQRDIHGWNENDSVTVAEYIELVHPEDRGSVIQAIRQSHDPDGTGLFDIEYRLIRRSDGDVRWLAARSQVVFAGDGNARKPIRTVGAVLDISQRKQVENSLRESEGRLAEAQRIARIGSWVWFPPSSQVWWSDALCTLFGVDRESAKPSFEAFVSLLHPEDQPRAIQRVNEMFAGGVEFADDLRIIRPDGVCLWLHSRAIAIRDEAGKVIRVDGTDQDITDRKQADERIRATLREKESLLKEVHHRVKNNLQIISSLLSLQSSHHSHSVANEVLSESQNRIRAMALVHETLYRSDNFANVNLWKYLNELCGYLFQAYGVDTNRIQFVQDLHSAALSLDKTITCGLIVTEIVSNSLKYAFPFPRPGIVRIVVLAEVDGRLSMLLSDDGIGMPSDTSLEHSESLGLKLVSILVDQLGGELKIRREKGTAFDVTFNS